MANITISVDDSFVEQLAAAIVRQQLGGKTEAPADNGWPPAPADDDPWGSPPSSSTTGSLPPVPNAAPPVSTPPPPPAPPQQAGTFQVQTPKGTQQWTIGAQNAPACGCGQAAAYIQGSTNGRAWARWGCAKGRDKATFRSKCDFSEWA